MCFSPVLKPLACGRQSRCLGWTYKLPGGQIFSIKLSALLERATEKTSKFNKKTPIYKLPRGVVYYCLRNNCPINSSNFFFAVIFRVKNYRINSRTNFCCNFLPCFIQNRSLQKAPPCAKINRINSGRNFCGNLAVINLPN